MKNCKSSNSTSSATAQFGQVNTRSFPHDLSLADLTKAPAQGGKRRNRKSRGSKPAPTKHVVGVSAPLEPASSDSTDHRQLTPAAPTVKAKAEAAGEDTWEFDVMAAAVAAAETSAPKIFFELPPAKRGHYNEIPQVYRYGDWEDDAEGILAIEMPEKDLRQWPLLGRYRAEWEYQEKRLNAPVEDDSDYYSD